MREERRKRRKRQQIITLVVCALAVAALIWGIATVVRKLTNYGNRSIASSQSDIQEDQPTDTSTADQTVEDRFAGVARNSYDAAGFYKEDGFLRYGDGTLGSEVGVDISSHQQSVDWEAVKAAGVDFAILRAGYRGYTEGAIQEDETFLTNLAAAKAAGLKVGVYFFSQALDKAEADLLRLGGHRGRGADGRHGLGHADGVRRGVLQACGAKWLSRGCVFQPAVRL